MAVRFSSAVRIFVVYRDGQSAAAPGGYQAPYYAVRIHDRKSGEKRSYRIDADTSAAAPMHCPHGRAPAADSSEAYTLIAAQIVRDMLPCNAYGAGRTLTTETGQPLLSVLTPTAKRTTKDYAITHYSASTYTSIPVAIVEADSYGEAWGRFVARYGTPKGNANDMGVVTARAEHYTLHGVAVPRIAAEA